MLSDVLLQDRTEQRRLQIQHKTEQPKLVVIMCERDLLLVSVYLVRLDEVKIRLASTRSN